MNDEIDKDELAEVHCPNCDHRLDKPINDIWKDPNVKLALKEGRSADDIMVIDCPKCNRYGYWNQGQYFFCRFCNLEFYCADDDHPGPLGIRKIFMENAITLADTVTVPTDGYDNETQPRE